MSRYLSRLAVRSGITSIHPGNFLSVMPNSGFGNGSGTPSVNGVNDIEVSDETVVVSQPSRPASSRSEGSSARTPNAPVRMSVAENRNRNEVADPDIASYEPGDVMGERHPESEVSDPNVRADDPLRSTVTGLRQDAKVLSRSGADDSRMHRHTEYHEYSVERSVVRHAENLDVVTDNATPRAESSVTTDMDSGVVERQVATEAVTAEEQGETTKEVVNQPHSARQQPTREKIEYHEAIQPVQKTAHYPHQQTELRVIEKPPVYAAPPSRAETKSSAAQVQVRIGNIQVDVHQDAPLRNEPPAPQPATAVAPSSRPLRLSRHYLRGW